MTFLLTNCSFRLTLGSASLSKTPEHVPSVATGRNVALASCRELFAVAVEVQVVVVAVVVVLGQGVVAMACVLECLHCEG